MTKNELAGRLAEEHELPKGMARNLVESVFQMISDAAQRGEEVSLFGFGRFKVAERAARKGRNPQTGEAVKIAASKNLKFTPARSLKTSLNTKRKSRRST